AIPSLPEPPRRARLPSRVETLAMPMIALPVRLGFMDWRPTGRGQETTFVIAGLLSVRIEITRTGYVLEGSHGRRVEGPAASIGAAKQAALTALRDALGRGLVDVEAQLRVG